MKLNNLFNKSQLLIVSLVVLSVFVGLSCIAAADTGASGTQVNDLTKHPGTFVMSVNYNAGTGYHWEVSPDSYGVKLIGTKYVQDHPGLCGSSGTAHFKFKVTSKEHSAKLVLISPTGEIVDEVVSNK